MRHYLLFSEDVCSSIVITGARYCLFVGQWCVSLRSSEAFSLSVARCMASVVLGKEFAALGH